MNLYLLFCLDRLEAKSLRAVSQWMSAYPSFGDTGQYIAFLRSFVCSFDRSFSMPFFSMHICMLMVLRRNLISPQQIVALHRVFVFAFAFDVQADLVLVNVSAWIWIAWDRTANLIGKVLYWPNPNGLNKTNLLQIINDGTERFDYWHAIYFACEAFLSLIIVCRHEKTVRLVFDSAQRDLTLGGLQNNVSTTISPSWDDLAIRMIIDADRSKNVAFVYLKNAPNEAFCQIELLSFALIRCCAVPDAVGREKFLFHYSDADDERSVDDRRTISIAVLIQFIGRVLDGIDPDNNN